MIGKQTGTGPRTGRGRGAWLVLLILLAAAVVPAVCVLWFMNAAMRNERLAVRQRLTDVYRRKLQTDRDEVAAFLSARAQPPPAMSRDEVTMRAWALLLFRRIVQEHKAQSAILLDDAGRPAYPYLPDAADFRPAPSSPHWQEARALEFQQQDYAQAARAYARVASEERLDASLRAQALLAQARCLARSGEVEKALEILLGDMSAKTELQLALDPHGRSVFLDGQLLAIQSLPPGDPRFKPLARLLAEQVNNYGGEPVTLESPIPGVSIPPGRQLIGEAIMTGRQRLLFMETLAAMRLDGVAFPTLEAERLAQRYLAESAVEPEPLRVTPTGVAGLWQMASADSHIVYLLEEARLIYDLKSAAMLDESFSGTVTRLELPGSRLPGDEQPFLIVPASEHLPGWRLALYLEGEDPFAAAARRQVALYLWTGGLAVGVFVLLAALVAGGIGRQMRLTRLKNDLIATVSHELKTPLASMRVLVDTLLAGRLSDRAQETEYLQLIARENARLSRLIDNFLTFSRMERKKRAFVFEPLPLAEVVKEAVAAAGERLAAPGCRLEVDVPTDLPLVLGDRDALVTAVLNLLDNAWKYTGDDKQIGVQGVIVNRSVSLLVTDNGVGLSRRAARKVFRKFWQVDRRLSRGAGGVGLGLSIVKFIVTAHGGTIRAAGRPGEGSTFTIELPAADEGAR